MTLLASKIRAEIERAGAVPFSLFMEMALYYPQLGYYETKEEIGRRGDFYTSVSVGSLFGELLAFQFAEWIEERTQNANGEHGSFEIVEAGAHNGQLALDILNWFKKCRPEIFGQLDYRILEPSARRQSWQRKTLDQFSEKVSWSAGWPDFPRSAVRGPRFTIVLSNELLDAMPVHRIGWDAKTKAWFEWGVGYEDDHFVWKRLSLHQRAAVSFPQLDNPGLLHILPDGFTTEICPLASEWWNKAASKVSSGMMITIDYGLCGEEFFAPQRSNGTLRSYFQHHVGSDSLSKPGQQDITAQVNFSALQEAGEKAGLKTEALMPQSKFLTGILGKVISHPEAFGEWTQTRAKQFQTLTHPEHLGRSFQVLIQSR